VVSLVVGWTSYYGFPSLPSNRWKQVLTKEPSNIQALLNLAYVDASLDHYSQALDSLDAVLAIEPDNKEALYRTGKLLYRREQYTEAASTLRRLSEIEPGYEDTMTLLSNAYNRTRRHGSTMDIIPRHNTTYT
jgi:tetratricopeptide (TPR) repeat protein